MLKIEKLSQKWVYGRQDEDYLYYEDKNTKYKFNKVYWREWWKDYMGLYVIW